MATGKTPDPRRRKTKYLHATHFKVDNGKSMSGYKAGEIFGCYGHRTFAHQPCLLDVTDGDLSCPYCAARLVPEWRGYLPIWDTEWALRYALIGEDYFPAADAIPHRAQIIVSRAKNPISPLVVREETTLVRQLPERAPWSEQVDMVRVCLGLWKCAELDQWYAEQWAKPKTDKPAAPTVDDPSIKKLQRLAKAEAKHLEEQALADVMAHRRFGHLTGAPPATNGHARKPK